MVFLLVVILLRVINGFSIGGYSINGDNGFSISGYSINDD